MNKTLLLEKAKELNIPCRNRMKTKEELEKAIKDTITRQKVIIFGPDIPVCMTCLDELRKQQVIEETRLGQASKNIVMDGDTMIDRKTGEVLSPGVDFAYWKDKL